jgi:anti-sigma factor RsiW
MVHPFAEGGFVSHLEDRATALADGELDHEARDLILAHLAQCPPCREEAERERATKRMLVDLDGPEPSRELNARLLGLAARSGFPAGPDLNRSVLVSGPAAPTTRCRVPVGPHTAVGTRPVRAPRRRARFVVMGTLSGLALAVGGGFTVSGPSAQPRPALPPVGGHYSAGLVGGGVPVPDATARPTGVQEPFQTAFAPVLPGGPGAVTGIAPAFRAALR